MNPPRPASRGRLDLWLLRQPWTEVPGDPLVVSELSAHEMERAAAFHRAHDRLLYLSAHIALRRLLAAYLRVPAREVSYVREPCPGCGAPHGRPALAGDPAPLHFSLSHSNGLALFGVATQPVGVDVEKLPNEETVELCSAALHPAEQSELNATDPAERQPLFGRLWTRKEAYLKGIGTGLSRDLAADYLGQPDAAAPPASPDGWTVRNVPCGSSHTVHVAAAAVRGDVEWPSTIRWLSADCLYAEEAPGISAPGITAPGLIDGKETPPWTAPPSSSRDRVPSA